MTTDTLSSGSASASSIDPAEAVRYAALAATWWDTQGPFWPLHRLNTLRTAYLREQLAASAGRDPVNDAPLAGLEVLDVGCGGGLLAEAMAALGASVQGIDVVPRNIAIARSHAAEQPALDLDYAVDTAESLAARGRRFDVVLSMEVVEHVADLDGFFDACMRLVRPGGHLAVATLNRTLRALLFAIIGAEYVLGWLPRGTHQWRRFVRPEEISALAAARAFREVSRTGVAVNPLTRRFRLCDSMAVNYMMLLRAPDAG
ncbi:MAG: bifunctional 2-polyprenyl-6-hydroxyphenol methylase/3-demethylubiquinol 3-O-methyltransferase UbiG [Gammaproteobacteria bacterium]